MYTIQHKDPVTRESKMQDYGARNYGQLLRHLAAFQHEIFNVYEGSTMITKRVRTDLIAYENRGSVNLNAWAQKFVTSPL